MNLYHFLLNTFYTRRFCPVQGHAFLVFFYAKTCEMQGTMGRPSHDSLAFCEVSPEHLFLLHRLRRLRGTSGSGVENDIGDREKKS